MQQQSAASPISSRSSSRASVTSQQARHDERVAQMSKLLVDEVKQGIITEMEDKFKLGIGEAKLQEESKELVGGWMAEKMREENKRVLEELEKLNTQQHATHQPTQNTRMRVKAELNNSIKNVLNETFANDWNELAVGHSEDDTEELELALWKEMSSTLQEVYRIYRNTNNEMKVNRKISIDVMDDRLTSLLTRMGATNVERARYLQKRARENLEQEERRRTDEIRMGIELEIKTLEREIAETKRIVENEKIRSRTMCIIT